MLLSDINFTSMIPELSRSADHLCPDGDNEDTNQENLRRQEDEDEEGEGHHHGHFLQPNMMHCFRKG